MNKKNFFNKKLFIIFKAFQDIFIWDKNEWKKQIDLRRRLSHFIILSVEKLPFINDLRK